MIKLLQDLSQHIEVIGVITFMSFAAMLIMIKMNHLNFIRVAKNSGILGISFLSLEIVRFFFRAHTYGIIDFTPVSLALIVYVSMVVAMFAGFGAVVGTRKIRYNFMVSYSAKLLEWGKAAGEKAEVIMVKPEVKQSREAKLAEIEEILLELKPVKEKK